MIYTNFVSSFMGTFYCGIAHYFSNLYEIHKTYRATPEELICQQETLDEILAVLALCTDTQRERFLLHALYELRYAAALKLLST